MRPFVVVLLHSTDEPEIAVAGLRAAAAAGGEGVLFLEAEGARLAARGVAEALSGGPRPDARALLDAFTRAGGRVLVSREAWAARGYAEDALVAGASLAGPEAWLALAREGAAFASF